MSTQLKTNESKKLTIEDVKSIQGFEHLTDAEAIDLLQALHHYALLLHEFIPKSNQQ